MFLFFGIKAFDMTVISDSLTKVTNFIKEDDLEGVWKMREIFNQLYKDFKISEN